jgi:hypothetical protein
VNEQRLRELHHRVERYISGGMNVTKDGEVVEIIHSTISCCSCLGDSWEAGPCQTLEAIEDDGTKDVVELVTWGNDRLGNISLPLEGYRGT